MGARKPLAPELTPDPWLIVNVYMSADDVTIADGRSWYVRAHAIACELAPGDPATGAGVLAALSPQMGWLRNVALAREYVATSKAPKGITGDNALKAEKILSGAFSPLEILGGDKVRAFYACIIDPGNVESVCIDRHAFDVAVGRVTSDETRKALRRVGVYDAFAAAYREAARILSELFGETILPSQVHVVTWVVWRKLKGIED